ncbi:hypothetical protein PUW25_26425 (plasmid) [Paenibacillus urinalis]|uniref:Uncharacterized protein n=1 Tax=Paenibacillus urinalis TaxID=521520 RepID=A0ABY7XHC7_9BACL|nr:hypothetical protein [Paenibacillus urinalis]WDI05109.1 hypothetical protein PUW25_26425 [Paenibacillus urinalis]
MATIGQTLTAPETGWKRIDNTDSKFVLSGSWGSSTNEGHYGGSGLYNGSANANAKVSFRFYGTKIRWIGYNSNTEDYHESVKITIDGISETFSSVGGSTLFQALQYEKNGLPLGFHTVEVSADSIAKYFYFDAIDIDEGGYLTVLIGGQLTSPEAGWKRIENNDPLIQYAANRVSSDINYNAGTIKFRFSGSKLRLLYNYNVFDVLDIDGVEYELLPAANESNKVVFEILDLTDSNHVATITTHTGSDWYSQFNAFDIDGDGSILPLIGGALTAPQDGWKRYDDQYPGFKYKGSWTANSAGDTGAYKGVTRVCNNASVDTDVISFRFTGDRIRIIAKTNTEHSNNVIVRIDGVEEVFSIRDTLMQQRLAYEKTLSDSNEHVVEITGTGLIVFDAVDIKADGRLLHPDEATDVANLEVGKRIRCNYVVTTSGTVGAFSNLGKETGDFLAPSGPSVPNGDFYFIMVEDWNGKKILIADRNIQTNITWNELNSSGVASGSGVKALVSDNGSEGTVRLMTGGNSSANKDNQWDIYIVNSSLNGAITAGDNNVWNYGVYGSWTSTTHNNSATYRTLRGGGTVTAMGASATSSAAPGFRPVLEIEPPPIIQKFLIQDGEEIKTYSPESGWIVVGQAPATQEMFDQAMESFNQAFVKKTSIDAAYDTPTAHGGGFIKQAVVNKAGVTIKNANI